MESIKWTTANHRFYWERSKQIGVLCPFPYNYKNILKFANDIYSKAQIIDREYAKEMKRAFVEGFVYYDQYLTKYNREG